LLLILKSLFFSYATFLSDFRYYSHNNDYLEICRCYKAIYEIPSVKENPAEFIPVSFLLSSFICYLWYCFDSIAKRYYDMTYFQILSLHADPEENILVLGSRSP
jgi:hypothetical protein